MPALRLQGYIIRSNSGTFCRCYQWWIYRFISGLSTMDFVFTTYSWRTRICIWLFFPTKEIFKVIRISFGRHHYGCGLRFNYRITLWTWGCDCLDSKQSIPKHIWRINRNPNNDHVKKGNRETFEV